MCEDQASVICKASKSTRQCKKSAWARRIKRVRQTVGPELGQSAGIPSDEQILVGFVCISLVTLPGCGGYQNKAGFLPSFK